ncbi:hypothetical protein HPG69_014686 [Diceros bicornis minor]|uniref:Cation efflux protein cytoplasmic domain-containing protein n=1 Tax=Diceros bicornis minor TaxID=77932 RepID=A0A7J7EY04_DICBM|nr:hypothetical protein HPG69_014686 [Diceros bicornis minor]
MGDHVLVTSGCAVVVNIVTGLILHQSGYGTATAMGTAMPPVHNQRTPSSCVLVAAYILYFKPKYVDPICTFLFSILVLGTTLTILRDVNLVLMEGTSKGVGFTAIWDLLLLMEGVEVLHTRHIWVLTVAQPVLSVHLTITQNAAAQAVLKVVSAHVQGKFHFHTMTIRIDDYSEDMKDCQACQGSLD